jgi:hypothetical protein
MSGKWWQWRGQVSDRANQGAARPQASAQSASTGGSRDDQSTPLQLNSVTVRPIAIQEDEFETKRGGADSIGLVSTPRNQESDDDADPQGTTRRLFEDNTRSFVPSTGTTTSYSVSAADIDRDRQAERIRKERQKEEISLELARDMDRLHKQEQEATRRAEERIKALDREARQVQFESKDEEDEYSLGSAGASTSTPPRLYPNLNPVAQATTPRTVTRGKQMDLDQLSTLLGNQYMKATADKPPKFAGQPPLGREQIEKQADGSLKKKLNWIQWRNAVELWFTMTGTKQENMRFVYALSMLEGAAQVLANNLTATEGTPIEVQTEMSDGSIRNVIVQPQTWSWLKEKLTRHYMPSNYDQLVRNELRWCKQRMGESVAYYYARFTNLTCQLARPMDPEQQHNDFRDGLLEVNKGRVDEVTRVTLNLSGLGGANNPPRSAEVLSPEQMLNICQRGELEEQHNQRLLAQKNSYMSSGRGYGKAAYQPYNQGAKKPGQFHHANRFSSLTNLETNSSMSGMEVDEYGQMIEPDAYGDEGGHAYEPAAAGEGQLNAIGSKATVGSANMYKSKPFSKAQSPAQQAAAAGKQCWTCGGTGHFKRQCPIWLKNNNPGSGAAAAKSGKSGNE